MRWLVFAALMAPATCHAADVGGLIQKCIGWGTKGFVVVTLVVYSFIRWILCDLLGSIWSDNNRQRIDVVLKVLSASIVMESVFGLFSGTLDKMGF